MAMSEPVDALAPFVERALDGPDRVEALGKPERPRPTGSSGWGAADHAAKRVD